MLAYQKIDVYWSLWCSCCTKIIERRILVHFVSFCVFLCLITSWKVRRSTILENSRLGVPTTLKSVCLFFHKITRCELGNYLEDDPYWLQSKSWQASTTTHYPLLYLTIIYLTFYFWPCCDGYWAGRVKIDWIQSDV